MHDVQFWVTFSVAHDNINRDSHFNQYFLQNKLVWKIIWKKVEFLENNHNALDH